MDSILAILRLRTGDRVVVPPYGLGEVLGEAGRASAAGTAEPPEPCVVVGFPGGHRALVGLDEAMLKLRRPSPPEVAEQALAMLRAEAPPKDARPEETLFDQRMAVVSGGDLGRLARLVRLLHALPDPSPGELRFRAEIEAQVIAEIGHVLGLDPAGLEAELGTRGHETTRPPGPEPAEEGPPPDVPCHLHPRRAATDSCADCLRPICEVCATADGTRFLCPPCARRRRRRRRVVAVSLLLGLVLPLAALAAWLIASYEPPFDYGKFELDVKKAARQLEEQPCDRVKMLRFAELLLELGDHARLIARADRYLAECGDFDRLLWVTFEAHKREGEYPEALPDVGLLVERYPRDKDFRWWRGEVHERLRDWPRALADYRQALTLQPRLRSIPFSLARVATEAGSPCEGISPLEQVAYHHEDASADDGLLESLERLYRDPACRGMAGRGSAVIEEDEDGRLPVVEVDVGPGQRVRVQLALEVGLSLVTPELAARLGLVRPAGEPLLLAWDGRDVREGWLATLPEVALADARAGRVEALVTPLGDWQDDETGPLDGVLGLSFLSRFALGEVEGGIALEPKIAE